MLWVKPALSDTVGVRVNILFWKAIFNTYQGIFNAPSFDPLILLMEAAPKELTLNAKNIY